MNKTHPKHARRMDDGTAFLPDPSDPGGRFISRDNMAETLAEEFLTAATSAEDSVQDTRNEVTIEELGGPFVETTARETFARGTDASNPRGAERAAFPTVMRSTEK